MTHDEIINAWNKQADYMNKWDRLGEDEKLEWAMKLEREACAKVVDDIELRCIAKDVDDPPLKHVAAAIRARGEQA
jgi:hypothetical protein